MVVSHLLRLQVGYRFAEVRGVLWKRIKRDILPMRPVVPGSAFIVFLLGMKQQPGVAGVPLETKRLELKADRRGQR